ncbi:hypothetical protein [Aquimarina mytili]|uniref:Peptidase S74 domain-containing protein n=1 Tax=Aquimarina mytili TaxID=874423 RepID=A0A937A3B4_9FLAO|nr:hypothetical protein [Aquimarina mytili]MBL0684185.1 hypothetical protein [Aquimarina mytili]
MNKKIVSIILQKTKKSFIVGVLLSTTWIHAQLFTHVDTAGVEISGNTVVSVANTSWNNSGGSSAETLGENGYVSGIPSYGKYLKLGLSDVTGGHNWDEYSYCFYVLPNGNLDLYDGPTKMLRSTYSAGDVLKIEKLGKTINFYRNDVTIGTITNIPETKLHVDYIFFDQYGEITFVDFASDQNPDNRNPWTVEGNNLYTSVIENNVGIGTKNPGSWKLAVAGKVVAEEVKIALQNNWPDYVFNHDYTLLTLADVEKHINEKGHLPNIPSAKEVSEEGIFMGEMNAKLLQKIEELTLYTIHQEKEIEELKSLVQKLLEAKQ